MKAVMPRIPLALVMEREHALACLLAGYLTPLQSESACEQWEALLKNRPELAFENAAWRESARR